MPDVIVLLPGILGSVLTKNGHDVWGSGSAIIHGLSTFGRSAGELRLEGDDPEADTLEDGVEASRLVSSIQLIPGFWKVDVYSGIRAAITELFEVTLGQNYFEFPYDWRRDNRAAAHRLQRQARVWLGDWRRSSGSQDAKLILVGHSMGGLVARYYLEVLEGWRDTRALLTMGTPYRGSLNAVDSLSNGVRKGPFGLLDLTALARSLTSSYQLLPWYRCYDDGDGHLKRLSEVQSIPQIDMDKIGAGRRFHDEIRSAVEAHRSESEYLEHGYTIFPVVGIRQPTNQSAQRSGNGVKLLTTYEDRDLRGDGTVPRVSAIPPELSDEHRVAFAASRHASLQNAESVQTQLEGALSDLYLDLGAFLKPKLRPATVGLDLEDVYFADEPVAIEVDVSDPDVPLRAEIRSAEDGAVIQASELVPGTDPRQHQFPPLKPGTYRIRVLGDESVEPVEDVFAVAAVEEE
jgi:hypothetical protein